MKMTVEFNSIADLANFSKFIDQRLAEEQKRKELDDLNYQLALAKQQLERAYARLRFKDDKKDVNSIPLEDVPLKVRTYNALKAQNCETVGHVLQLFTNNQLRGITNFGNGSFTNLKKVFKEQFNIELRR